MNTAASLGVDVGIKQACEALNLSRATLYRHFGKNAATEEKPAIQRTLPPLALDESEKQAVPDALHSERFRDSAPRQV